MTITENEQGLDSDLLDALDFSQSLLCEEEDDEGNPCNNKADYRAELTCCGEKFLICEECLFAYFESIRHGGEDLLRFCGECGRFFATGDSGVRILGRV